MEKQKENQSKLYELAKQFFGFGDDPRGIKIILPSVSRQREVTLELSNYPLYENDVSPDDVLSAMRIHSLLTAIYGIETVEVCFQEDLTTKPTGNLILIGGPPTNSFTRGVLKGCPLSFCSGKDSKERVICLRGKAFKRIKVLDNKISQDYCLISKKTENHNIEFVVAGLRAYGQVESAKFLGEEKFYRQAQDVSQADNFQILVEVEVDGKSCVEWRVVKKLTWPSPNSADEKAGSESAKVAEMSKVLQKHDLLYLDDFAVVGNFVRYNEQQRNKLIDYYLRIKGAIDERTTRLENYIFWGPPSAGKTMLVKETDRALQEENTRFIYHPFNLSKMTQTELSRKLQDVADQADKTNLLCFVDEVDAKTDERWPFEMLVSALELNKSSKDTVVWILAGSSGENKDDFLGQIKGCYKGEDVVSRIPSRNVLTFPPQEMGDRLLVCLSEIDISSKRQIKLVEKFALLYLTVSKELDSLRQLGECIGRAVSRVGAGDNRLKYDHLFEAGDNTGREFWTGHRESASKFMNSYLQFARKRGT